MKYYLIVGEASGDLHASNLMRALKNMDEHAESNPELFIYAKPYYRKSNLLSKTLSFRM